MGSNNLTQIHETPTREGKLQDLVFISNPTLVKSSVNVPGIFDHDIIITDTDTKVQYQRTLTRTCYILVYSKADWTKINIDLENLQTTVENNKENGHSVHQLWDTFKKELFGTIYNNIPHKEIRSRNRILCITRNHRKMIKRKQRLFIQEKKSGATTDHTKKKWRERMIRQAEWEYVNTNMIDGLDNNNTKPFWKFVKSKRQDNNGTASLKKGTTRISDSKGKAEILQDQFKSVFTKPTTGDLPNTKIQSKKKSHL